MSLTNAEIELAKLKFKHADAVYEHNDCIRIAYAWLDAQLLIKSKSNKSYPLKHLIEKWAGRYVSQDDVIVAAYLHPNITGDYPHFNISSRLILPNSNRLTSIGETMKHPEYHSRIDLSYYHSHE